MAMGKHSPPRQWAALSTNRNGQPPPPMAMGKPSPPMTMASIGNGVSKGLGRVYKVFLLSCFPVILLSLHQWPKAAFPTNGNGQALPTNDNGHHWQWDSKGIGKVCKVFLLSCFPVILLSLHQWHKAAFPTNGNGQALPTDGNGQQWQWAAFSTKGNGQTRIIEDLYGF